jgi:2-keto-3-deoxy-L-rhamnonate aldolase RhmA
MWKHIEKSDNEIVFVAQIEDPPALEHLDAIAAVDGVDSLFIGRGDLTAAFADQSKDPPKVRDASERAAAAALKAKKTVSVYTGGGPETTWLQSIGASMFVLASDQSFLRNGAAREMGDLKKLLSAKIGA